MEKIILTLILGFGIGVWFQYLNVLFWKNYAKNKYRRILNSPKCNMITDYSNPQVIENV